MWVHSRGRGWHHGLALAALCAAVAAPAGAQILTTIPTITPNSAPTQTVTDPRDGTIWFVETAADHIGTITPSRAYIGEVNLILPGSRPTAITLDRNGTAWFTESGLNKIGSYTRATNYLVEYQIPGPNGGLTGISVDATGKIWFTESLLNQIGVLNPSTLTIDFVPLGTMPLGLQDVTTDSTGTGWFTENQGNQIGSLDLSSPTPTLTSYSGGLSGPYGITTGPNNDLWFTENTGGTVDALNPSSGTLFQFPTVNGTNSQPRYIDSFQNQTGQNFVAWTEPTPGNSLVGVLNPSTGQTSQIQATNPFAGPTGVTYANDNTLWWSETNSSDLTGSFFNSSIVQRLRPTGDMILASLFGPLTSDTGVRRVDLQGHTYQGFRHMRRVHRDTKRLKRRRVPVTAIASLVDSAGLVRLASLDGARIGTSGARVVLAGFHTASLDGPPVSKPTQQFSQTALINVIQIGAPTQIPVKVTWAQRASNARMLVSAIDGAPNNTDQVTIGLNDCITLQLMVKFTTGQFWDVSNDPNTQFLLDPMRGHFISKNVWCPNPEDENHAFPIYGRLYSPDYGTYITSTVHVVVK